MRRLAGGVTLAEYHGVLDDDTAGELEEIVERRRNERSREHRERVEGLADELDG